MSAADICWGSKVWPSVAPCAVQLAQAEPLAVELSAALHMAAPPGTAQPSRGCSLSSHAIVPGPPPRACRHAGALATPPQTHAGGQSVRRRPTARRCCAQCMGMSTGTGIGSQAHVLRPQW